MKAIFSKLLLVAALIVFAPAVQAQQAGDFTFEQLVQRELTRTASMIGTAQRYHRQQPQDPNNLSAAIGHYRLAYQHYTQGEMRMAAAHSLRARDWALAALMPLSPELAERLAQMPNEFGVKFDYSHVQLDALQVQNAPVALDAVAEAQIQLPE
jgi:hypothetical protein